MAILEQIDFEKPITFTGYKHTVSTDPLFVDMANRPGLENITNVAEIVTNPVILPPDRGQVLMSWLRDNELRDYFDENLQMISETEQGEPLLTGWMDINTFHDVVRAMCQSEGQKIREIGALFDACIPLWASHGVDEVDFEGWYAFGLIAITVTDCIDIHPGSDSSQVKFKLKNGPDLTVDDMVDLLAYSANITNVEFCPETGEGAFVLIVNDDPKVRIGQVIELV